MICRGAGSSGGDRCASASAAITRSRPGQAAASSASPRPHGGRAPPPSRSRRRSRAGRGSARPGPGPTSSTAARSGRRPARRCACVRSASSRKCWPSARRASSPCRAMASRSGGRRAHAPLGVRSSIVARRRRSALQLARQQFHAFVEQTAACTSCWLCCARFFCSREQTIITSMPSVVTIGWLARSSGRPASTCAERRRVHRLPAGPRRDRGRSRRLFALRRLLHLLAAVHAGADAARLLQPCVCCSVGCLRVERAGERQEHLAQRHGGADVAADLALALQRRRSRSRRAP